MATHTSISILTPLPMAAATMIGTCTPTPTSTANLNTITYPTILTEVYSCTLNWSMVPPFFDWTAFSNHEQTLTTLRPFPSKPTSFPYTQVVTVKGILSRTEWVKGGLIQSTTSTVMDIETTTLEKGKLARAGATSV